MLWLLPFICSGAICWLNRDRIAAVAAPRAVARSTFGAGPFATPYLLPQAAQAAGYGNMPYGTGQLMLPPAASPFAYASAPAATPFAYAYANANPSPEPSAPAAAATPIALLRCAADGCMVRPEPRAWDDATLGRMPGSFTAPKDFPVYVLSYGPVGWAHVLVNHPDEGAVEGWVEMRSLTDAPASPPSMGTPAASPATSGAPSTGAVVNASGDAMARHLQFMSKRGPGRAPSPPPPPRRRGKK